MVFITQLAHKQLMCSRAQREEEMSDIQQEEHRRKELSSRNRLNTNYVPVGFSGSGGTPGSYVCVRVCVYIISKKIIIRNINLSVTLVNMINHD